MSLFPQAGARNDIHHIADPHNITYSEFVKFADNLNRALENFSKHERDSVKYLKGQPAGSQLKYTFTDANGQPQSYAVGKKEIKAEKAAIKAGITALTVFFKAAKDKKKNIKLGQQKAPKAAVVYDDKFAAFWYEVASNAALYLGNNPTDGKVVSTAPLSDTLFALPISAGGNKELYGVGNSTLILTLFALLARKLDLWKLAVLNHEGGSLNPSSYGAINGPLKPAAPISKKSKSKAKAGEARTSNPDKGKFLNKGYLGINATVLPPAQFILPTYVRLAQETANKMPKKADGDIEKIRVFVDASGNNVVHSTYTTVSSLQSHHALTPGEAAYTDNITARANALAPKLGVDAQAVAIDIYTKLGNFAPLGNGPALKKQYDDQLKTFLELADAQASELLRQSFAAYQSQGKKPPAIHLDYDAIYRQLQSRVGQVSPALYTTIQLALAQRYYSSITEGFAALEKRHKDANKLNKTTVKSVF